MKSIFVCLPVLIASLVGCSSNRAVSSATDVEIQNGDMLKIEGTSTLLLQLNESGWKTSATDEYSLIENPTGTQIRVSKGAETQSTNPEARAGLLVESFAHESTSLGPNWIKAKTMVVAINREMASIPAPNLIWTAQKGDKEIACIHFIKDNQIYTIMVEDPSQGASTELSSMLASAPLIQ